MGTVNKEAKTIKHKSINKNAKNMSYISPTPSGRSVSRKNSRLSTLVQQGMDHYDEIVLEQAKNPYGRRDPATLEVLTRKRCEQLEQELNEKKQEIYELKTEKEELNKTINDLKHNQTTATENNTMDMSFEQLSVFREKISKQRQEIDYTEYMMNCMQENYEKSQKESEEQIESLHFQLRAAAEELQSCELQIEENLDMNKTISAEKMKYELLSQEYREKYEDYQVQINKIKAESMLSTANYQEKMDILKGEIEKSNEKLSYWKDVAGKKNDELSIMGRKLNSERAQRATASSLYRKHSVRNKVLEKKNLKVENENRELERELAASRLVIRDYQKRHNNKSVIKKMFCM